MTRPVIPRPGIKIRNRQRREGKAIKATYYASDSYARYAAENRRHAAADRARRKIARKLAGDTPRLLSPDEFAALNADRQRQAIALDLYQV